MEAANLEMIESVRRLKLPAYDAITFDDAIAIYEAFRAIMPDARPLSPTHRTCLRDILPDVDALVLDGYGVINVGAGPIAGIQDLFAAAACADVPVIVLTNGASFESSRTWEKYRGWDLPVTADQIVSSRDAMLAQIMPLAGPGINLTAPASFSHHSQPVGAAGELRQSQDLDVFERAQDFLFLGAVEWSEDNQAQLEKAFQNRPCHLHIANPDVVSPQEAGLHPEPGYWVARLIQAADVRLSWYGKPHAPAFAMALRRLEMLYGRQFDPARVAMVGDSLHTDIIGAAGYGMRTVLVTGHGLFRDGGADEIMKKCGIYPDWVVATL